MTETEVEKLEQAAAALEALRGMLGDAAVEVALASIRHKLSALKAPLPAAHEAQQRKQVTVLFADVFGFTAMSEIMDAEDVTETMNALWRRLDAAITAHGGTIDKHIGDAVMALWGVEAAREDDPEQAIRAALAMQSEIGGWTLEIGGARSALKSPASTLQMRIGINTGPVVLGEVGTTGEFTAMGDTVNVASRLQHAAPVGGILISHDTYRQVRGVFDVQALEPIIVKGKTEPVRAYVVGAAKSRTFRTATRGVEGVETRMIGREAELKQLEDAFEAMRQGSTTRLITVVGEAGVGKSRLLYEFGNWLDLLPAQIWYFKGRATPQTSAIPYALLRDLFAFRFEIRESDSATLVRDKLECGVAQFLRADVQMKAHLLGAWLGYDLSASPHLAGLRSDPRQLRDRAQLYLVEFFTAVADDSPSVIFLEDLHWADDQSLEALQHLARQCPAMRLLIVALARNQLLERHPAWGEGLAFHTRLDLRPLSASECRRLVGEILRKVDAAPPDLFDLIVDRAEGNPFYVEELIKMLVDDGVIVTTTEPWQVQRARLAGLRVPSTLTGVLQARLDGLQPPEKVTLQRSSVVGRVFWEQAVAFLSTAGPKVTPDLPLAMALVSLRARELIFQRERSAFEDTSEYIFKHALLRDVCYESVLKRERRDYHARAARWLVEVTQRSGRADEYAALIAEHYELAGEPEPAAGWYERAAEQAAARYANAEAVRCFGRALELTPASDVAGQFRVLLAREKVYDLQGARQAQAQDIELLAALSEKTNDDQCRVEAALRQANYANVVGDFSAAVASAQRTVELAQAAGSIDNEAAGRLLWARALLRQTDYAGARDQLDRALTLARAAHLAKVEADSLLALGIIAYDQGDYPNAEIHWEQALNLHRQLGTRRGESAALVNLGVAALSRSDHKRARTYYEQALRLKREIGDRRGEGLALGNLGNAALQQGDYVGARAYHEQELTISREVGDRYGEANALNNLGYVTLGQGDCDAARAWLEQALAIYRETGHRYGESHALAGLGLLSCRLGHNEAARDYAQQALNNAREINARSMEGHALTVLGHALLGLDRLEEASLAYQQALVLRRELGERDTAVESVADLARASLAQGDLRRAQEMAHEVLSRLESGALGNAHDPIQIYLTCYRVLHANQDPRAPEVLKAAYVQLQQRAVMFGDDAARRMFLDNVPSHRELEAAWRTMHARGSTAQAV